jgi:hypothetical protein
MKKDLEPAFARPHSEDKDFIHFAQSGMTLRDYFAAKALQGMLAEISLKATPKEFADQAYKISDAMLKARAE